MDRTLVSCEVFFVSPMSNLLCRMTLFYYQSKGEKGYSDMTLVFALVSVTHIELNSTGACPQFHKWNKIE